MRYSARRRSGISHETQRLGADAAGYSPTPQEVYFEIGLALCVVLTAALVAQLLFAV